MVLIPFIVKNLTKLRDIKMRLLMFLFIVSLSTIQASDNLNQQILKSQSDQLAEARYFEYILLDHVQAGELYQKLASSGSHEINALALYRLAVIQNKLGKKEFSNESFSELIKKYKSNDKILHAVLEESAKTSSQRHIVRKKNPLQLIIPHVKFNNLPMSECIDELKKIYMDLAPNSKLYFIYVNKSPQDPLIHLEVENIPLINLIELMTQACGWKYRIDGQSILLAEGEAQIYPHETQFYSIPEGVEKAIKNLKPLNASLNTKFKNYFKLHGIEFQTGHKFTFVASAKRLVATTTAFNHELIGRVLLNEFRNGRYQRTDAMTNELSNKLNSIIIPYVSFNNQSIDPVISTLNNLSKKYDPDKKGVKHILRLKTQSQSKVSLYLRNVSLHKLIQLICLQQDLKYKVTQHAVILADKSISLDTMEVRFYNVPKDFISQVTRTLDIESPSDSETKTQEYLKLYFERFGVKFITGSQVSYIKFVNRLVIKNTPEEHVKVMNILKYLVSDKP